jgi:hypothetical protein
MATRATYVLPAAGSNQNICFYIHYDGSLKGAAHYFYNMQQCKNMRSGLAGRFFRANAHAEFTACHEEHADTEFRYAINQQDALTVWQKDILNDEWRIVYHDFWYQFINTQILEEAEHLHAFKLSKALTHETIMTIAEAQRWVSAFTKNANKNDYVREGIEAIQAQIDTILEQQQMFSTKRISCKSGIQNISNTTDAQSFSTIVSGTTDSQLSLMTAKTWEERFSIFSTELEEAVIKWSKQNEVDYYGGYQVRIAKLEKCVNEFYRFFNQLVNGWLESSGILKATTTEFDLFKAVNQLRERMIQKYGFDLDEIIRTTRAEYGDDTDDGTFEHGG